MNRIVCSAHAEMIRAETLVLKGHARLLRTRGDDPQRGQFGDWDVPSAPHTRR